MTKRKPYSENATFEGHWLPLSDAARTQITKLLQLTPKTASDPLGPLNDVELILGSHDGVARTLGHPPVAADYVRTMKSIQWKCRDLVAELKRLDEWMSTNLEARLSPGGTRGESLRREPLLQSLNALEEAARQVEQGMRTVQLVKDSRGRKPNVALSWTVANLARIFARERPPPKAPVSKAPFKKRDQWTTDLLTFLDVALSGAGIAFPKGDDNPHKYLRELLPAEYRGGKKGDRPS